ncbi:MAG: transporter, partial [Myxococcota bacterium]|nr:transporter [Myxococcota bacterium]
DPLDNRDGLRDTDGDGLIDRLENELGTNREAPDTDGDGLSDILEVNVYRTDPLVADTDGGGVVDATEIENGTDPNDESDDFSTSNVSGDDVFGCSQGSTGENPAGWVWLCVLLGLAYRRFLRAALLGALICAVSVLPDAHAQTPVSGAMNIENFFPAGGRYRVFSVERSGVGPDWAPYAHILVHGQRDSLKVANGSHRDTLVERQIFADLNIGVAMLGRLQIDLGLPIALAMDSGDDVTAITPVSGGGLGDLYLRAKAMAIDNSLGGFGLGFTLAMTFPTGDSDRFRGDSGIGFIASVIPDYHSRWVSFALNLGIRLRTEVTTFLGHEFGHELTFGAGTDIHIWPSVVDLGIELFGRTHLVSPFDAGDSTALELLGGPKWWILSGLSLQVAAGAGLLSGIGTPDVRFLVGVTWSPRIPDRDGDGVDDRDDPCPYVAEDLDGFSDKDGCPELDNDLDGIVDTVDSCPTEPEDANGKQDNDGCPDGDADGDGLADSRDKCPHEREDRDAFSDADGCPDPDNDQDGILDPSDRCPLLAENQNGFMDQDGCPDDPPAEVPVTPAQTPPVAQHTDTVHCSVVIPEPIYFKKRRWSISSHTDQRIRRAYAELMTVLSSLSKTDLHEISIEGFAKNGPPLKSLMVSARRARSVKERLIRLGLRGEKVHARGYGRTGTPGLNNQVRLVVRLTKSACAQGIQSDLDKGAKP